MPASQDQVVQEARLIFFNTHLGFVTVAVVTYDYLLMVDREMKLLWTQRIHRAASLWYILIRLNLLVYVVLYFLEVALADTDKSYSLGVWFFYYIPTISMFITAVTSAMRAYAVSSRNKTVSFLAFSLGVVPLIVLYTPGPSRLLSRIGAIASDVIVIAVTWWNSYPAIRVLLRGSSTSYSLTWHIIRDGTLCFILMLILNVADIFLVNDSDAFSTTMICPLSLFILARLLLNLREAVHNSEASSTRSGFLDPLSFTEELTWVVAERPSEERDIELTHISPTAVDNSRGIRYNVDNDDV